MLLLHKYINILHGCTYKSCNIFINRSTYYIHGRTYRYVDNADISKYYFGPNYVMTSSYLKRNNSPLIDVLR